MLENEAPPPKWSKRWWHQKNQFAMLLWSQNWPGFFIIILDCDMIQGIQILSNLVLFPLSPEQQQEKKILFVKDWSWCNNY